ncbi:MAG: hypothetical protein WD382_06280 [Halofilum sp. (in: g-proteobacteria)]
MLISVSATLLSLAVAGGLAMGTLHMRRFRVPFAAGLGHAALATTGIVLLAFGVVRESQPPTVNSALLCFALAAVGGLFVLLFRLQGESPPGFMIGLHGTAAIVALALLWTGILGGA